MQGRRAKPLIDFDVPLRRKFPINQPPILKRLDAYNKPRSYDFRVKPFGFVQTTTPDHQIGKTDVLPIAPFEADDLADDIAYLAQFPQAATAREIGMSEAPLAQHRTG